MSEINIKSKRYISCPTCGKGEHFVEHLLSNPKFTSAGVGSTWYCKEPDCGKGFDFRIENGIMTSIEARPDKQQFPKLVLLRIPPQKESIFFIIEGSTFAAKPGDPLGAEHDPYFYNEHQCPTNFTRDIVEMFIGSDMDPHGLFEYRATAPYQSWHYGPRTMKELREIFKGDAISEAPTDA